jgi:hypothetical protein
MLHKYRTLILGALLGLGALAFSGAGASAAAMLPLSPVASGEANAVGDGIVQVNHKKNWNNNYFNNRCSYRYGGCRNFYRNNHFYRNNRFYGNNHFYRRNHYNGSNFVLPLIIGGGFGAYDYYDDDYGYAQVSNKHVRWCLNRYRSYNPRTNLWVAFSGKKHQCDSPYY